jgi:hypothetical protein
MIESDSDRAEPVREIAAILAVAYLRLRFPCPSPKEVDCPTAKSESCDEGLTR